MNAKIILLEKDNLSLREQNLRITRLEETLKELRQEFPVK